MLEFSAMSRLDLPRQLVEQILMRRGIDLATDDLLGAGDRDGRDLTTQFFACPVDTSCSTSAWAESRMRFFSWSAVVRASSTMPLARVLAWS